MTPDAVVTHHRDPTRSGVARFNALLAERLGLPLLGLEEAGAARAPLHSFKVSELGPEGEARVLALLDGGARWSVFLHERCGGSLEERLVAGAERVLAGNDAIAGEVGALHPRVERAWTPGLILEHDRIAPAEITVFSFGMAHKLRTDAFARLRELLEATGRSYVVRVSAANHETATAQDAATVMAEVERIFDGRAYFLGTLSDLAVVHELARATFFAAFFAGGVRANNTTVASAMERGAVVVTNLDGSSPPGLVHGETVVDLAQADALPSDPLELRRMSVRAMEHARAHSWERLVAQIAPSSSA